jgi:hypothetical protein
MHRKRKMDVWDEWHWDFWDPETEPLPKEPKTYRKISFCTACMNRLHDLMVTLPVNIHHNRDYPNVEFVVVNYNSQDKLDEWMLDYMMPYIEAGLLVYVHTTEPRYFQASHSRNISFKVATGDIVNNIDADNFSGRDFAKALNLLAEVRPEKAVFTRAERLMHGRLGFYKKEWLELGGYDEDLMGYGWDDINLFYRAMATGCKLMRWGCPDFRFSERIPTPFEDKDRYMEHKNWEHTEFVNAEMTFDQLDRRQFVVNQGRQWGKATLVRNFKEVIHV